MKRERPPQPPIANQLKAAIAQMFNAGAHRSAAVIDESRRPDSEKLKLCLELLFGPGAATHCDHNPALILRDYDPTIEDVAARYKPHAHDPRYLVHRTVQEHHIKTHVRGDGAQRSDTSERMHQRRMDENRGLRKRKPKKKIPARVNPWPPKGSRKLRSRGFR